MSRYRVALAAVVASLLAAGGAFAASARQQRASEAPPVPVTFTDAAGDTATGPDLTQVSVTSGGGSITFDVTLQGAVAIGADGFVDIYLDTDQKPATGSPRGTEYDIVYQFGDASAQIYTWSAGSWQPSGIAFVDDHPASGATASIDVRRTDIGSPSAISFYAVASSFAANSNHELSEDDAPDTSWWEYTLTPLTAEQAVKPVVGTPVVEPARPVAGKTLDVAVSITRSDDGLPMKGRPGSTWGYLELAVAGSTPLRPEQAVYADGVLRFSVAVPKTAAGKKLSVLVLAQTCCESGGTQASYTVARSK